jgi:hypothetical protein
MISLDFTGFHWISLELSGGMILLDFTGFHWISLDFTGFHWISLLRGYVGYVDRSAVSHRGLYGCCRRANEEDGGGRGRIACTGAAAAPFRPARAGTIESSIEYPRVG